MTIKEFDEETEKIISERAQLRRDLEFKLIKERIAKRDAFREAKQKWEDDGFSGPYTPDYMPAIQGFVEAAKHEKEETELRKELATLPTPIEEEVKEFKKDIVKIAETKQELHDLIEERKDVSGQLEEFKKDVDSETSEIEWLKIYHPEWILEYADEREGANAIWRGNITKGFREWCLEKEYKLGA